MSLCALIAVNWPHLPAHLRVWKFNLRGDALSQAMVQRVQIELPFDGGQDGSVEHYTPFEIPAAGVILNRHGASRLAAQ
jgi:hypothetical protein